MQLPIQTGVSAPTAAVGDGFCSLCVPLVAQTLIWNMKTGLGVSEEAAPAARAFGAELN